MGRTHASSAPMDDHEAIVVIRESAEHSLERLRTDRIDLYYQHRIDPNPISFLSPAAANLKGFAKI